MDFENYIKQLAERMKELVRLKEMKGENGSGADASVSESSQKFTIVI